MLEKHRGLIEQQIRELQELFSIEDILEMCDITEYDVLEILVMGGHIELPPFIQDIEINDNMDQEIDG